MEYGNISLAELEQVEYPTDKEAEAVVLFDIGKSNFVRTNDGFDVVFERTTRIKILNEAGKQWADVEIPFYQDENTYEIVAEIHARACNLENGSQSITELDSKSIFNEKGKNNWYLRKFAVPGVKVGSVIEYTYRIVTQDKFNLRDWNFQWRIPVVHSEYVVNLIPFYEYSWLLQGAKKFDIHTSKVSDGIDKQFGPITYSEIEDRFVMKNMPAFRGEEFISSVEDYIVKIDFQLCKIKPLSGSEINVLSTWDELNRELTKLADFGKYVKKSEKLAPEQISLIELRKLTENERFNAVIDFVKSNFSWNGITSKFATKSPADFVREKVGSSSDINLFAIGLLHSVGLEAWPVLLSTRPNGKVKYDYPFLSFFNYCGILVKTQDGKIFSDATEVLCKNNRLPLHCLNDKGLIVLGDSIAWVDLTSRLTSIVNVDIQSVFQSDYTLESYIVESANEYEALAQRKSYGNEREFVAKLMEDDASIIDSTVKVSNAFEAKLPFIFRYKKLAKPNILGDKILLSAFAGKGLSSNPLKQPERSYPIDMIYPLKCIYNATIVIPPGYQVETMPSFQKVSNSLFEMNYLASIENGLLNIKFDYYFKKAVYPAEDYGLLKHYYNKIIEVFTTPIALVSKKDN